jgi:acyl-CoA synthetase (AMP-forming)/AMP-acid ligase II
MVKIENCELTILGRVKEVIVNSSGENIYIDQLESKFYGIKDEGIDFTIIGFEDEPVMIVYVVDENNLKNIIDKIIEINNSLEIYTRIAKLYISRDNIEKTSTGKIKRNEIAKRIASNDEYIELVKL